MSEKQGGSESVNQGLPQLDARYRGTRTSGVPSVTVRREQVNKIFQPRLDLIRHSPLGFDWGHSGSGPAQLALALLAHASGSDQFALRHYQVFKHEIVARLPKSGWDLTGAQVLQSLRFVCEEARRPSSCATSFSRHRPNKLAVIVALLAGNDCEFAIRAQGCGRSVRAASIRALLTCWDIRTFAAGESRMFKCGSP